MMFRFPFLITEISPEELANILASKDRSLSGPMVEGKGLMLMQVNY